MEVLTTATNVLAPSRPPSGTSVLRPPATPRRQPQHPRSSAPRQSPSRTVYDSLAGPLEAGLAIAASLVHADHFPSSQPPLMKCCDDRLNPPWVAGSSRATTAVGGTAQRVDAIPWSEKTPRPASPRAQARFTHGVSCLCTRACFASDITAQAASLGVTARSVHASIPIETAHVRRSAAIEGERQGASAWCRRLPPCGPTGQLNPKVNGVEWQDRLSIVC
jgi:hypothetical protein